MIFVLALMGWGGSPFVLALFTFSSGVLGFKFFYDSLAFPRSLRSSQATPPHCQSVFILELQAKESLISFLLSSNLPPSEQGENKAHDD